LLDWRSSAPNSPSVSGVKNEADRKGCVIGAEPGGGGGAEVLTSAPGWSTISSTTVSSRYTRYRAGADWAAGDEGAPAAAPATPAPCPVLPTEPSPATPAPTAPPPATTSATGRAAAAAKA